MHDDFDDTTALTGSSPEADDAEPDEKYSTETYDVVDAAGERIASAAWPWNARRLLDVLPAGKRVIIRSTGEVYANKVGRSFTPRVDPKVPAGLMVPATWGVA